MEYRRRYVRHSLCKPRFTLHLSGSLAPPRAEDWFMGKLSGPGFQRFLLRYKWTWTRSLEPALRAGNERMNRGFGIFCDARYVDHFRLKEPWGLALREFGPERMSWDR